mmetsp:Transcript_19862/g.30091  ORF Transcript_19862/g.30091 Transcript_19862/m.30091 type:complete len:791 (+) Transcript_19862:62-2434(+)
MVFGMVKDTVFKINYRVIFLTMFWLALKLFLLDFSTPRLCSAFVLNNPVCFIHGRRYSENVMDLGGEHDFHVVSSSLRVFPWNGETSSQDRITEGSKSSNATLPKENATILDNITEPDDNQQAGNESKSSGENINTIFRIAASADGKIPEVDKGTNDHVSSSTTKTSDRIDAIYTAINNQRLNSLSIMDDIQNNATTIQTLRQSLENSGFMLLSPRDLDLCAALNPGYLLRLSIAPDLRKLDPNLYHEFYPNTTTSSSKPLFGGRVLIFRRGYSQEITKGRLLLPKLDYLQSSLVQRSASKLARKISDSSIANAMTNSSQYFQKSIQATLDAWQDKFKDPIDKTEAVGENRLGPETSTRKKIKNTASRIVKRPLRKGVNMLKNATSSTGNSLDATLDEKKKKIFERYISAGTGRSVRSMARKAKFVDPDSFDTDEELKPFLARDFNDDDDGEGPQSKEISLAYEYGYINDGDDYSRELSQSRSQLSIRLLKRISIANLVSFLSDGGRRKLIKSLFAESKLVEPTYEEVVVIWRPLPEPVKKKKKKLFVPPPLPKFVYEILEIFGAEHKVPQPPLPEQEPDPIPVEIRTFGGVPMANLLAVLPKTRLIFRPADALIFDLVNVFSLLAVLASQKFDSPQLDLIALVSVTLWIFRTFFRYSNKVARYDLLVNKFLKEKISHRNKGALKYIANEAAVQRARRAALVHDWLAEDSVRMYEEDQYMDDIVQLGSFEINKRLPVGYPVYIDVQAALDDLVDLGLIQFSDDGRLRQVETGDKAMDALAQLWNGIFLKI